jgi:predicted nucleic acid-binding protein
MSEPAWLELRSALVDTGVFILWYRGDARARRFFRTQHTIIYYSKVVRKELLRPPISDAERRRILTLLRTMRLINPDPQIVAAYSDLLERYPYLRDHLADALIAASAWAKNLPIVTVNRRHFDPITEIEVVPF